MMHSTNRLAFAMLGTFSLALAISTSPALAQEKSAAAKALEANPELKTALDTPTFRELKEKLPKVKIGETRYFFVEGDIRLDEPGLMFYASDRADQEKAFKKAQLPGLPHTAPGPGQLLSHNVDGQPARFTPGSTLSYCVIKSTFGSDAKYQEVVDNMKAATQEWAQTINLKFEHAQSEDDSEPNTVPPNGVTFTVQLVPPGDPDAPIASSFFPGDPASERHLLIFSDYFATDLIFDKVGVIRHELGHVVGFRHEHIRSEAPPVCQGEPLFGAIPQTKYDPKSVMHYFCGNRGSRELKISVLDRVGARQVYGAPPSTALGTTPVARPIDADPAFQGVFKDFSPR
jgi:hypothetical protein